MRQRRQRSRRSSSYLPRPSTGLDEPFPQFVFASSSFKYTTSPKHQISVKHFNENSPCCYIFAATYAAHKFVEFLISLSALKPKWKGTTQITVGDLEIWAKDLDEVIEYEPSSKEAEWAIPPTYVKSAQYQFYQIGKMEAVQERTRRKPENELVKNLRKTMVTAIDLAKEYDVEPKDLRGLFRFHGVKKPQFGWAWDEAEIAPIRKMIEEALS